MQQRGAATVYFEARGVIVTNPEEPYGLGLKRIDVET